MDNQQYNRRLTLAAVTVVLLAGCSGCKQQKEPPPKVECKMLPGGDTATESKSATELASVTEPASATEFSLPAQSVASRYRLSLSDDSRHGSIAFRAMSEAFREESEAFRAESEAFRAESEAFRAMSEEDRELDGWLTEPLVEPLSKIPAVQVQPELTESGAAVVIKTGDGRFGESALASDDPAAYEDYVAVVERAFSIGEDCTCCICFQPKTTVTSEGLRVWLEPLTREELYERVVVEAAALQAALDAR